MPNIPKTTSRLILPSEGKISPQGTAIVEGLQAQETDVKKIKLRQEEVSPCEPNPFESPSVKVDRPVDTPQVIGLARSDRKRRAGAGEIPAWMKPPQS